MITLTREEAQQVLDALEDAADHIGCPDDDDAIGVARRTLRARLAQPEPELEPVEWDGDCVLGHCGLPSGCDASGYCRANPPIPKKEWVGLTHEERRSIIQLSPLAAYLHQEDWMYDRLFEIEAKLKEKNDLG